MQSKFFNFKLELLNTLGYIQGMIFKIMVQEEYWEWNFRSRKISYEYKKVGLYQVKKCLYSNKKFFSRVNSF